MRRQANRDIGPIFGYGWKEIERVTDTDAEIKVSIPSGYTKIGFFIVGGGGGGASENLMSSAGGGGWGGNVKYYTFDYIENSTVVCKCGSGGTGGRAINNNGARGSSSYVVYNGDTYTANGGWGGISGPDNVAAYYNSSNKDDSGSLGGSPFYNAYVDDVLKISTRNPYSTGLYGEDGVSNPFDLYDFNLYGAGGAGAGSSYYYKTNCPEIKGGATGGGNSGYGRNNTTLNKGQNATFYGGGGGGGAFSSEHTYGIIGGDGYQGIVIIYGKK